MVNEYSASASGNLCSRYTGLPPRCYYRQYFCVSTVQRNIGIDKTMGLQMPTGELGTVKLTLQKFYRINGGSTQLKVLLLIFMFRMLKNTSRQREKR